MARPSALLIMGGADYHNTGDHYEVLAGLFAGPAGLNVTVTDDFPAQSVERLSGYDLLILWATHGRIAPEPVHALFEVVGRGTPLLGLHAAPFTVKDVPGGPEAIGVQYQGAHLPYQECTVHILDRSHPITAGVEDFRIADELYRLDVVDPSVHVLASYDGREASAEFKGERNPRHDEAHEWRLRHPQAPLLYNKPLGRGWIHVNALGHDRAALSTPALRRLLVQAAQWLIAR